MLGIINRQKRKVILSKTCPLILEGGDRGYWWRVQGNHETILLNTQSNQTVVFISTTAEQRYEEVE